MNHSLFEADDPPQLAARLRPILRSLAERGVYIGTSSWKYEGWLGTVYSPERYQARRRLSKKKFESKCLREYAETFPAVGGDFSFYQFPSREFWSHLFGQTPASFVFGLKVPEEVTVPRWPSHARYGARAGTANEHFLNAALLERAFLQHLESHREQVGVLIFEFGTFSKSEFPSVREFLARLVRLLDALPQSWRYAVEVRNPEYLLPEYFSALTQRNVAHVFNAWTRMPTLADQIALPGSFTADFTVVRALLKRGRSYERAVSMFEPYREIQEPDDAGREAIQKIIERTLRTRKRAYIFVNNRLEGNAPSTIEAVVSKH